MHDRFAPLREATATALLGGNTTMPSDVLKAVMRGTPPADLAPLVEKVRAHAYKVTDRDLDELRDRFSEDQLFEVIVAAAFGAAEARLAAARQALEQA
jgi:hypothetical protein